MTMQRPNPKTPCFFLLVLATAGACSGAAVEDVPPPSQPGNMMPMGMTPGNTMPGSMNPPGSNGTGPASIKFCNGVGKQGGTLEMELVMGGLTLKAPSGSCAPMNSCEMVPGGVARLSFKMDGKEVYTQDVNIEAGQQYVVISTVDQSSQKVGLTGGKLKSGASCASENPFPAGSSGPVATAGKFCHGLSVGQQGGMPQPASFELVVGTVRMTAMTGACSSGQGAMCLGLPTGAVTASLLFQGQEVATKELMINSGREYLFGLDIDAAMQPVIVSQELAAGMSCATAGRGGSSPPGTMIPPGTGVTELKLCNGLPVQGTKNVVELDIGGQLTLKAMPGQCTPMKGAACAKVAAGPTEVTLILDGVDVGSVEDTLPVGAMTLKVQVTNGQYELKTAMVPAGMMCSAFEPM